MNLFLRLQLEATYNNRQEKNTFVQFNVCVCEWTSWLKEYDDSTVPAVLPADEDWGRGSFHDKLGHQQIRSSHERLSQQELAQHKSDIADQQGNTGTVSESLFVLTKLVASSDPM